jgi:predicted DNA-binding protein (UPF0251 family)
MKNSRFVVIDPKLKQYKVFEGSKCIATAISEYSLYPDEVETLRLNCHDDELFDGEDPDGDLIA